MERPTKLDPKCINPKARLQYDLTIDEVTKAMSETYRLFNGVNDFLTTGGFRPLEELLLGNSLSGILSELLVKNIARVSHSLVANLKVGGHPDLLPQGYYSSNFILKGEEGIEIKSSIHEVLVWRGGVVDAHVSCNCRFMKGVV